jgi:hypothetical protein
MLFDMNCNTNSAKPPSFQLVADSYSITLPRWHKRGRIYHRDGGQFFKTHTTRPIPYKLNENRLRVFFSSRCAEDIPHPTFIDVDPSDPSIILEVCERPLLPIGRPGTFDDSGITPVSIIRLPIGDLMYYVGWKRRRYGVTIETSIGVAKMVDCGKVLVKLFEGPIISQDTIHPIMVAAPFVRQWGDGWRMWYCSGSDWRQTSYGPEPIYSVCRADSVDGINWQADGRYLLQHASEGEVVSAPWIVSHGRGWHMWYSYRGSDSPVAKRYRIGVASSTDGDNWQRRDGEAGLECSAEGWDSEMVCYPSFYYHAGRTVMLYCGNHVGRGGIGWAVASEPFDEADLQ